MGVYTEKRDLIKVHQRLKRDLSENKMELNRLQKQLTLKMNELEIERANQIKSSHDKSSMLRKKIHEKYGQKFSKKIEKEVIKNAHKPINVRFDELTKAFKSQSNKYQDLEEVIEHNKLQIIKYEELIQQIQERSKREIKQLKGYREKACSYKKIINELLSEQNESDQTDSDKINVSSPSDEAKSDDLLSSDISFNEELNDDPPSFQDLAFSQLAPLKSSSNVLEIPPSFSNVLNVPQSKKKRIRKKKPKRRKSPRFDKRNKTKPNSEDVVLPHSQFKKHLLSKKSKTKIKIIEEKKNRDPFYMSVGQKTAVTSVKMKVRGGGINDDDDDHEQTQKTEKYEIKIKGNVHGSFNKKRRTSQPINVSLAPSRTIQNEHKSYSYSSDPEDTNSQNKSRSPVPILVGIDNLIRNKTIEIDESAQFDQSP